MAKVTELGKIDCANCKITKELKVKIEQLEKRLARYENANTPPSCLKNFVTLYSSEEEINRRGRRGRREIKT